MNYHRIKRKVFVPLLFPALLGAGVASAQDTVVDTSILDRLDAVAAQTFDTGAEIQVRINRLSDQADELVSQFRDQSRIVEGLEVYNAGMRRTIAQQERTIAQYDVSIAEAAELQRQIAPLMERMMFSLEQFVALDIPVQLEERQRRLRQIRATFDDSSVNVAERFRLVLQAYQQENNYGRSMDAYTAVLEIDGVERDVDILRVGRIALLYQSSDQQNTGVWDRTSNQWVPLDNSYRRPVAEGIRMARQLASTEILELPIHAPE